MGPPFRDEIISSFGVPAGNPYPQLQILVFVVDEASECCLATVSITFRVQRFDKPALKWFVFGATVLAYQEIG